MPPHGRGKDVAKTAASKPAKGAQKAAVPESRSQAKPAQGRVSPEERYAMIARVAYLRAAARGFAPGNELGDWLAAEAEVELRLKAR